MNIQALMKQAQKMKKDMLKDQDEIQNMSFTEEVGQVCIKANGKKTILDIKFNFDEGLDKEDLEMLQDSVMICINKLFEKIDKEVEKKMSKYGSGLNGLF